MDVCFLTSSLPAPEPIAVYARALGADVVTEPPAAQVDVAVAVDWHATARLFEVRAKRHVLWVDHFAHRRLGTWQTERFAAQLAYDLPVDFVAAAPWVRDALADLRPEARCVLVTSGRPAPEGEPAASALEARPSAPASAPAAPGATPSGPGAAPSAPLRVHLAGAGDERAAFAAMAEPAVEARLEQADVVVMLSAVDGVLGAPLDGFRHGATAVVGPADDARDLVAHGENGFVADAGDPRGAARLLDLLARDRDLLGRLREAARATAAAWPTPERAAVEMEAALRRLLDEDPPDHAGWPVRLMADAVAAAAVFGREHATLTAEVHRLQAPPPPLARRAAAALKRRVKARLEG